jgi:excisionase family DNA binding protein
MSTLPPLTDQSVDDLLHQHHYTPDQLAALLGVSPELIVHEAHEHRLRAYIVDHHILSIRRDDVVAWLETRRLA